MPRLRRYGGTWLSGRPPSRISPAVADSKPAIIMRVVVLPEPLGPSSVRNSPGGTVRETPSTAITGPKALGTSTSWRAAPVCISLLVIVGADPRRLACSAVTHGCPHHRGNPARSAGARQSGQLFARANSNVARPTHGEAGRLARDLEANEHSTAATRELSIRPPSDLGTIFHAVRRRR